VINVDKNPAYTHSKQKLERENKWPKKCKLRQNKYMNTIIEQDHRTVKWKMTHAMGYHTMWYAHTTITGVETMHMLRKGQVTYYSKKHAQSLRDFIHRLFDIIGSIFPLYSNRKIVF
jgi:transposase, IS6 family